MAAVMMTTMIKLQPVGALAENVNRSRRLVIDDVTAPRIHPYLQQQR